MPPLPPAPDFNAGRHVALALVAAAVAAACNPGNPIPEPVAAAEAPVLGDLTSAAAPLKCVDPPVSPPPVYELPPPPPSLGGSLDGQSLRFAARQREQLTVRFDWDAQDPTRSATSAERSIAGRTVRLQRAAVIRRDAGRSVAMSTGGRTLADVELVATYTFRTGAGGRRTLGVSSLAVVDRSSGAVLDRHVPEPWFTDVPGSCEEEAMVQYGPFPWNMPSIKWPDIQGCSHSRCVRIALGWLRLHHNTWRASQMFAYLETRHDEQKIWAWKQPGIGPNGTVGIESSPAYWYGPWDGERYDAVKEAIGDLWKIVREAETGDIDLRLICPDAGSNPGNVCFTAKPLGHHFVKGWINICDAAFTDDGCNGSIRDGLDETLHHEPLHHVFVWLNGLKAVKDTFTHWHGAACASSPSTERVYCSDVRHFVEYGRCNHHNKIVTSVEANAFFVHTIGTMVRNGTMTRWPKPADPTPHPPDCVGPLGCQCNTVPPGGAPDGDYTDHHYCEDDEAPAVCMKTKFNASETVGICKSCDEVRGPGCPCNDLSLPCEQGFCWGGDTGGSASATGTCYRDPPPAWACLADCEALLGNGAFCLHDHPDRARCVPYGTSLPEASNCWWNGGHMDPQELACTTAPECGAAAGVTCAELRYPAYFVCDASQRCVAQP